MAASSPTSFPPASCCDRVSIPYPGPRPLPCANQPSTCRGLDYRSLARAVSCSSYLYEFYPRRNSRPGAVRVHPASHAATLAPDNSSDEEYCVLQYTPKILRLLPRGTEARFLRV